MSPETHSSNPDGRRGTVLLAALVAMVIVSAMAAAMFTTAHAEKQASNTNRRLTEVTHLAESATATAEREVLLALANTLPVPTDGTMVLGGHSVDYTIESIGPGSIETNPDGIQTIHQNYLLEATATVGNFNHTVHRVVDVGLTPIFQFAIFYDRDLELLPGPSMTLSGRVHSNQDIYVGVGSGSTLTVDSDYFRSVGGIYRKRKDTGSATGATVRIREQDSASLHELLSQNDLDGLGVPSVSGYDSDFLGFDANDDGDVNDAGDWVDFTIGALDTWQGTVQTKEHGMNRIEPPSIGSIKLFEKVGAKNGDHKFNKNTGEYYYVGPNQGRFRKGRYHENADLVIVDGVPYDANGSVVATMSPDAISETTMYDAREGMEVSLTEIDMSKLGIGFPDNGLIYAYRSDSSVDTPHGIRLVNGEELPGALTVASENPVYVQGNYNSENKKPAAVISDAVNLLSNAWDDSKSKGNLPAAEETVFNLAMITGGNETNPGVTYSGGFENLPRFHENWKGVNCIISGSFVKIFASAIGAGNWSINGDYYKAPNRLWDYDTSFNNVENLPPFTPVVAQVKSAGYWD